MLLKNVRVKYLIEMTFPPFFSSLYFPFKSPNPPRTHEKNKWNEKKPPDPRLLRAKVIRISERCFSTKPNALFNNRIEIENLEKNSNYYYDCYVHWLLFKNTIKRKRKTKKKSNPTTHIMYEIWMMKWRNFDFYSHTYAATAITSS